MLYLKSLIVMAFIFGAWTLWNLIHFGSSVPEKFPVQLKLYQAYVVFFSLYMLAGAAVCFVLILLA